MKENCFAELTIIRVFMISQLFSLGLFRLDRTETGMTAL